MDKLRRGRSGQELGAIPLAMEWLRSGTRTERQQAIQLLAQSEAPEARKKHITYDVNAY